MPSTGGSSGDRSKRSRTENRETTGSVGPDSGDDLFRCSKSTLTRKCRVPKKYLDECSTVSPVPVPRKLRSSAFSSLSAAMKKRTNELIPPTLRVPNQMNHVADGDGDGDRLMKSKLKRKQIDSGGSIASTTREGVSKDEEEVAEALFALSGGLGGKSSTLTKDEICAPSVDVGRRGDDPETDNHPSDSAPETDFSIVKPPSEKLAGSKPEVNLHLTAFVSENQQAICDSVSGAWTQIRKTRSKSTTLEKGQAHNHQETALTPNADGCDQTEVQHANTKTEKNGSSSKRNLSSAISCDTQRSPITSFPARIGITSGTATPTLKPNGTAKTDASFSAYAKNSWRRCCTHAYICRFIKALQEKDANNKKIMQSSTYQKDQHRTDTDQSGARNALMGVSSPAKNATEVENAILLHKRLVKDQQQAPQPYDVFAAQKQSLGFFFKHAGVGQAENSTGIYKAGNSSQTKNQVYASFTGTQNLYSSTSSSGHFPIAPGLQVQLPPYLGSRSYFPFTDANALSVQPLEQQNGNRLTPLLMANFESGVVPPGLEIPPFFHPGQASFQHSIPSLEAHEAHGYTLILQQQQQQQHVSSTAKGPYHHLPSGYDANVGRARPDKLMLHHCR